MCIMQRHDLCTYASQMCILCRSNSTRAVGTLCVRLERLELLGEEVLKLALNLPENLNSLLADLGELLLNNLRELLLDRLGRHGADSVATLGDNLGVVCTSTTVPSQDVGGVTGDIGQGVLGGDGQQASLQLGRGDCLYSVCRVDSRLEGEKVGEETIVVLAYFQ